MPAWLRCAWPSPGFVLLLALAPAGVGGGPFTEERGPEPLTPVLPPARVLLRGPVHEAFASPLPLHPLPGPVISQQPPEPVDELSPEFRPARIHTEWIPGYWAWEEERGRFIWVSGTWRAPPPGHHWVPGYWTRSEAGFRWVQGTWSRDSLEQLLYAEPPPPMPEEQAGLPSSLDYVWAPGCWILDGGSYRWRSGHWVHTVPGWVWVPSHYVWTPRGSIFIDGYWDYPLTARGLLMAPLDLAQTAGAQTAGARQTAQVGSCSPAVFIDLHRLLEHLFIFPGRQTYCFGDYFSECTDDSGCRPWFSDQGPDSDWDPLRVSCRRELARLDAGWFRSYRAAFEHCLEHATARPPLTLAALQELEKVDEWAWSSGQPIAGTLVSVANRGPGRLLAVSEGQRTKELAARDESNRVALVRAQRESEPRLLEPGPEAVGGVWLAGVPEIPWVTSVEVSPNNVPVPDRPTLSFRASRRPGRQNPVAQVGSADDRTALKQVRIKD